MQNPLTCPCPVIKIVYDLSRHKRYKMEPATTNQYMESFDWAWSLLLKHYYILAYQASYGPTLSLLYFAYLSNCWLLLW